jgi:leucyl/phenylalanyl-tRNA---protein transferase
MFSVRSDASKVALVALSKKLLALDVPLIDCQVPTDHLLGLGAELISREDFLRQLRDGLTFPTPLGPWTEQDGRGMS